MKLFCSKNYISPQRYVIQVPASTLIDNIYTNVLDKSYTSGIPISDHQMYFCVMNENYLKPAIAQQKMLRQKYSMRNLFRASKLRLLI